MSENKYMVALGYISTIVPEMVIDVENPLEMMRQVYNKFDQLQAERDKLKAENERLRKLIDEILNHALANRDTEHEFFRCGGYTYREMPEWVQKAKAALREVDK